MLDGKRRASRPYFCLSPSDRMLAAMNWVESMRQFGNFTVTDQLSLELQRDGHPALLIVEFAPSRQVQRIIVPSDSHFHHDLSVSGEDMTRPLGCGMVSEADGRLVLHFDLQGEFSVTLYEAVIRLDMAGLLWNREVFAADAMLVSH